MPPGAFPLSRRRSRSFRLGAAYRWRIVLFDAVGRKFRLLIAYNAAKEQYVAVLAEERERDNAVIASYEFHGTHAGWHLLSACGPVEACPEGVMRGPWQKRFPPARDFHRRTHYGVSSDEAAVAVAARFFRLHKSEGRLPL